MRLINYVFRRQQRAIRSIPGVDRTFGGYFKPTDPPPSRSTPGASSGHRRRGRDEHSTRASGASSPATGSRR